MEDRNPEGEEKISEDVAPVTTTEGDENNEANSTSEVEKSNEELDEKLDSNKEVKVIRM